MKVCGFVLTAVLIAAIGAVGFGSSALAKGKKITAEDGRQLLNQCKAKIDEEFSDDFIVTNEDGETCCSGELGYCVHCKKDANTCTKWPFADKTSGFTIPGMKVSPVGKSDHSVNFKLQMNRKPMRLGK